MSVGDHKRGSSLVAECTQDLVSGVTSRHQGKATQNSLKLQSAQPVTLLQQSENGARHAQACHVYMYG